MWKNRNNCIVAVIVVAAAVVSLGAGPAWAAKSKPADLRGPSSISNLRELLRLALIDLEEVNTEIKQVRVEIEQLDQLIKELQLRYEITLDPRLLSQIDDAMQERAGLELRLDKLIDKAADLEAYIARLRKKIKGSIGQEVTSNRV